MKRYISILAALALILAPHISLAAAAPNTCSGQCTKTVNICQGQIDNCTVGDIKFMGAAGDKLSFDTSKVTITNLGRITKTKEVEINLSLGQQILAFIPTEGSQKDHQMKLLLYPFDINNMPTGLSNQKIYKEAEEGKKKFPWARTMLKIYRQMGAEEQWTEVMASFRGANLDNMGTDRIEISPDAGATLHQPEYKDEPQPKPLVFDLTKSFD